MSQQPQRRLLQEPKRRWQWPLDLASYDRAPLLSHAEQQALDQFVVLSEHVIPSPSQRLALSEDALSRLLCPMRAVLTVTGADVRAGNLAVWFLLRQMHRRRAAFWAWSRARPAARLPWRPQRSRRGLRFRRSTVAARPAPCARSPHRSPHPR